MKPPQPLSRSAQFLSGILRTLFILILSLVPVLAIQAVDSTTTKATPVKQIIVVFKTHFDIGYTDMASNVVQRYRTTMMDAALKVVDQNRLLPKEQQFVWTVPGWPMNKILEEWPGQTPDRKQRILQAMQDGRFMVHALPFSTHTELLELEDLVRGLGYSSRLSRSLHLELPRDAKMTDVPCHSWILPTLLKNAGVDFLHLGCNAASSSPLVPPLFWWQGPDGSRLLTMYTAEGYGTGLIPPRNWPHKTWLALIHTGDNHGPPTPEEVKAVLDQAARECPGVKVRIGRLSDFSDALLAEKPNLPIVRGDMPDTWIHGPMSDPAGAKLARNIRPEITTAEALHTQLSAWGIPCAPIDVIGASIASAYEQSLLYGEHTWGGAFTWIYGKYQLKFGDAWRADRAAGLFDRIESSWDEHTAHIQNVTNLIAPLLRADLETLAQSVQVQGYRIVVYNPLPWKRSGLVSVPTSLKTIAALKAIDGQEVCPTTFADNSLQFIANDIPAMGYRTFVPVKALFAPSHISVDSRAGIMENSWFKITLDPARGTIRSLVDKKSGRELVNASATYGFGQYLYQRFDHDQVQSYVKAYVKTDAEWGINELGKPSLPSVSEVHGTNVSPGTFSMHIEQTPISAIAIKESVADSTLTHATTTRVILYDKQPYVDLEITLHNKPFDPWPEAGWLCMPFNIDQPEFRLGRLGSIVNPATDIIPGCNFDILALNTGMTIQDRGGRGIGLCPMDNPLVSLGQPGCYQYSKYYSPKAPNVFVNLFNNQWSTNFRLWNQGTWTSRIRIWTINGRNAEKSLTTPSAETRQPLLAATAENNGGKYPATQTGVELSRRGVNITAFGPNPDGDGIVLRLWEMAGQSGKCRVRLPFGTNGLDVKYAKPVDLRGSAKEPGIPIKNGAFQAVLKPFAPASYILGR
jgi:hypothetical protein